MKRTILLSIVSIFGLGLLASMVWVGVGHATDIRTGSKPTLASNEVTDNSLYAAGDVIVVSGTVKGDVMCAGNNIDITGVVEGDVICGGQSVRVMGEVDGDVRVAGSSVEIGAEVTGNVTAFGESVVISSEAKLARDLTVGGARLKVEGEIGRDLLGGSETMVLAGKIGRNVDAEVNALTIDANNTIGGDLNYASPAKAQVADGAAITGEVRYTAREQERPDLTFAARMWGVLFGFVAMLLVGVAVLIGAPRAIDAAAVTIRRRPLAAFAGGAAVLLVVPITAILLMISVFGIPLGIVLLLLWVAALMSSLAIGAYGVGWLTVEKLNWPSRGRRLASLVLGLLIVFLVGQIPIIGGLFMFFVVITGLGSMAVLAASKLRTKKVANKKA